MICHWYPPSSQRQYTMQLTMKMGPSLLIGLVGVLGLGLIHSTEATWELDNFPHHGRGGIIYQNFKEKFYQEYGAQIQEVADTAHTFEQQLDHNDKSKGTFEQRYFVDNSYFDPAQKTIFLSLCGEGPCGGTPKGYARTVAKAHNALLLALEHRYYGDSVPNDSLENDNLVYLTVDQVMEDIADFLTWYKSEQLGGSGWSILVVGGSYAGALSSWFRTVHPEIANASWSSSGVVNAILKFPEFDEAVASAIGEDCSDAVRQQINAFVTAINAGDGAKAKGKFGLDSGMADADFYYMLADASAMADQYDHKDALCSSLQPIPSGDEAKMNNYRNFVVDYWGKDFAHNCFYDTRCLINNSTRWQPTSRAWRWQKCTELAYFQVAPQQKSLRPQAVDFDYHINQCKSVFNFDNYDGPSTQAINDRFGGAKPSTKNASQIFYSNGSDDPWKMASVRETLSNTLIEYTAVCDGCGHCRDLSAPSANDPQAILQQRVFLADSFQRWLPSKP